MRLQRIETKEHCKSFLDQLYIARWRDAMNDRFRNSPLFKYEELWRVFCHELSVNIFEHAGTAGFLAGRIVESHDKHGLLNWVKASYPECILDVIRGAKDGFLELCVCDAGRGFADSLGKAYKRKRGLKDGDPINDGDVLAFAFDEVGTSKQEGMSWATSRHALGRILMIVSKYGGALRVRSGTTEILFASKGGKFERIPGHLGYKADYVKELLTPIPGAHFQLILPLKPLEGRPSSANKTLSSVLTHGFQTDSRHVQGHLVPLLERLDEIKPLNKIQPSSAGALDDADSSDSMPVVGPDEFRWFRDKCEMLREELLHKRAPDEALVLDFSQLKWSAAQFETFIFRLQDVVISRPTLLVEIDPLLARDIITQEEISAPTYLTGITQSASNNQPGESYIGTSECKYLETISGVHINLLGIDKDNNRYIFGLPDQKYQNMLLKLCQTPQYITDLCEYENIDKSVLETIFNNINPLFHKNKAGAWSIVWDDQEIDKEAHRVMVRHFINISQKCQAWRGRKPSEKWQKDESKMIFNLPWRKAWVTEFFESARILARQRYADEAAQRLVYRLENGLSIMGKSISDVGVLACVTAPAILLAYALHRWWPGERPAIADLGPYYMLNPNGILPTITSNKGIVIIQDVLDTGVVSEGLVRLLRKQNKEVICILGLVRLVESTNQASFTSVDDGWTITNSTNMVPHHAMIDLRRPLMCQPQHDSNVDAQWVEPRTLRPFSYRLLRREGKVNPVANSRIRPSFFEPTQDILHAGHFVYGERHYLVTVDIRNALMGDIGNRIRNWLADICAGINDSPAEWESDRGKSFAGEITAVLMPLHSQIHYIWPGVEEYMAQRNRRVLSLQLDATLFLGFGPAYRLPMQFGKLIRDAARSIMESILNGTRESIPDLQLRILILDDAMVRGRTAETILAEIDREVEKANDYIRHEYKEKAERVEPIHWIRYFVVFGQMGHARHQIWSNLTQIGHGIPFVYEEYCWISGLPNFEESSCPACNRIRRLTHLTKTSAAIRMVDVKDWATRELENLRPIALDAPSFAECNMKRLPHAIHILPISVKPQNLDKLILFSVEEAILRFYEVTYMSYPPKDLIQALSEGSAWPKNDDARQAIEEYEQYRWTVIDWCLNNWPRILSDSAQDELISQVQAEINARSNLVENAIEGLAQHFKYKEVANFILKTLDDLADLERLRNIRTRNSDLGEQRSLLYRALTIFLSSIPYECLKSFYDDSEYEVRLLDHIETLASGFSGDVTFIGWLYLRFTQPRHGANPGWALGTLAETLFRGRNPDNTVVEGHTRLPALLGKLRGSTVTRELVLLINSGLSLFLAALDEIRPFVGKSALPIQNIYFLGEDVLEFLRVTAIVNIKESQKMKSVIALCVALETKEVFCTQFDRLFRLPVSDICILIQDSIINKGVADKILKFSIIADPEIIGWRILAPVDRLVYFIENWSINPALDTSTEIAESTLPNISHIHISRHQSHVGTDRLKFRILTSFACRAKAEDAANHGRHHNFDVGPLEVFGVTMPVHWEDPNVEELKLGYKSIYEFYVPAGYIPKINN